MYIQVCALVANIVTPFTNIKVKNMLFFSSPCSTSPPPSTSSSSLSVFLLSLYCYDLVCFIFCLLLLSKFYFNKLYEILKLLFSCLKFVKRCYACIYLVLC